MKDEIQVWNLNSYKKLSVQKLRDPRRWSNFFFNLPKSFQPVLSLGFTQPLNMYEKQKKIFLGSRARPMREANDLTAIYEPTL
jgi:hypothetical protein